MYRDGHIGVSLLLLAAPTWFLLDAGLPGLAAVLAFGALAAERLPDKDMYLPIPHRGPTHTLAFGLLVGLVEAGVAYYIAVSGEWSSYASEIRSISVAGLPAVGSFTDGVAGVGDLFGDPLLAAAIGLVAGFAGIVFHLAGDVITVSGIRPLKPVSDRRLRVPLTLAKNRFSNTALLVAGSLAFVIAIGASA